MAQELKRLKVKNSTEKYQSATWFNPNNCFAELKAFVQQLNAEGYRVLSITPLQAEGFHQQGLDRLTTTDFGILCEKV